MSDDLTKLRLDVARALGWVFEESLAKPQETAEWWRRAHRDTIYVERDDDGNVVSCDSCHADWTASLGACQEVLDAIRERNWRYRIQDGRGEHGEYAVGVSLMDATRTYAWPQVVAPTLPEALCRAFVEAVEANGE